MARRNNKWSLSETYGERETNLSIKVKRESKGFKKGRTGGDARKSATV